jgi:hypothetical protein
LANDLPREVLADQDRDTHELLEAQAVFPELTPRVTPEELEATVTRPSAVRVIERSGLYTLNHSVVHAREHLGQIWMTRDLWNAEI